MYLTLPSNSSMNFFPENRLNNYSTRLQTQLHLGEVGAWEVGLTEIHYPRNWNNVVDTLFRTNVIEQDEWCITLCRDLESMNHTNHYLSPGHYRTISEVCAVYGKRLRQYAEILWDRILNRVRVKLNKNHRITLSKPLAGALGLPEGAQSRQGPGHGVQGKACPQQNSRHQKHVCLL